MSLKYPKPMKTASPFYVSAEWFSLIIVPRSSYIESPAISYLMQEAFSLLLIYIHLGISWLLTNCFLSGTCNFVIHLFITFIFLFPIIHFFLFFTKILSLIFLDSYSHFQNIF